MNTFQEPFDAASGLECALKVERKQWEHCPVHDDLDPGYMSAQAWGYVVAAYFACRTGPQVPPESRWTTP